MAITGTKQAEQPNGLSCVACFEQLASRIRKLRCPALDPQTLVPGDIEYMHSVIQ